MDGYVHPAAVLVVYNIVAGYVLAGALTPKGCSFGSHRVSNEQRANAPVTPLLPAPSSKIHHAVEISIMVNR